MTWSRFCRVTNLTFLVVMAICWIPLPWILDYVFGISSDIYDVIHDIGFPGYWIFLAIWEKGTLERVRGNIKDKMMIGDDEKSS